MKEELVSRRKLLKSAGVAAAALTLPGIAKAEPPQPARRRVLRVAHMTDIHVMAERKAALGFERCLEHAQGQKDKPDMIVTGGDMIMDALDAEASRVKGQWDIYKRVLKANIEIPIEHTIGNHDIWGWGKCQTYKSQSLYGKRWVMDTLELPKTYKSFDKGGWHFIILDSNHPVKGNGYCAKLDLEQFEWLVDDLAAVPANKPVIVFSHIPILSACAFYHGQNERFGRWSVPGAWMHLDSRNIKDLFNRHPNVKLCVSGHIHLIDRVTYCGVTYTCRGAVSGGWWGGDFQECTFGYSMIDLFSDGGFQAKYVPFGWKEQA